MTAISSSDFNALNHESERPALLEGEPARDAIAKAAWPVGQRILFRFVSIYLLLYCFPFPIGSIPGTDWLSELCDKPWQALCIWVGRHVLHLSKDITAFGGGQHGYDV